MTDEKKTETVINNANAFIDDDKNTQLHKAAANNDTKEVLNALAKREKIDVENYLGWTPLMMATRNGHMDTVKLLLDKGADASRKNKFRISVFLMAVANGNLELVHLILQHLLCGGVSKRSLQDVLSPLSIAIIFANNDVLEYLLTQNFNINAVTKHTGVTPLMFAAAMDNCNAFSILTKQEADSTLRNHVGFTAQDITLLKHRKTNISFHFYSKKTEAQQPPTVQIPYVVVSSPHCNPVGAPQFPSPAPQFASTAPQYPSAAPQYQSPVPHYPSPQIQQFAYYAALPQCMGQAQEERRKSSNTQTPVGYGTPDITPIRPKYIPQMAQVFFPPDFSPSQFVSPVMNYSAHEQMNGRFVQYYSPVQHFMQYSPSPTAN